MSADQPLTLKAWFSTGWTTYRKYFSLLVTAQLIQALVVLPFFWGYLATKSLLLLVVAIFLTLVLGVVLNVGGHFISLKAVRKDNPRLGDLFFPFKRYGQSWLTMVYYTLIFVGGLILLIIPGLYMAVEYAFGAFAVTDKQMAPREALKYSAKITDGHRGKLFVAGMITFLLSILTSRPLVHALETQGTNPGSNWMVLGLILAGLHLLVLSPWLDAAFAAAYDSLVRDFDRRQAETPPADVA